MKKTIFVLAIIAALAIALYKWLTNGNENNEEKQETTTEEVKEEPANNETINVKPETNAEEVKNGNDTVNENHK
jgi:type IV secretory pathway VirB10-like protein